MSNLFADDVQDGMPDIDAEVIALERDALAAVRSLEELARQHPARTVVILAAVRKISTIAGAKANSLGLKHHLSNK